MGSSAIGEMNIVLSANAASFSAQIDQAQRKLDQLAGKSRTTGRTMVSNLQATSGGLRLLEGGMTNSLRAAERFLSTIPGVGEAMKAAFPVVGAIAFGAILVRLGKEVYDFLAEVNKVPAALKQGFDELGLSSRMANDELEKTDIALQNHIAKLEGKPQNHLAEALIDARIAADKLAESLEKDNREVTELLERQKISLLGGLTTGKESTSSLAGTVNAYNVQMEDLANQRSIALSQGDSALAADLAKQLKEKQDAALSAMTTVAAEATAEQATVQARGAGAIGIQRNGDMSLALDPSALLYIAHGEQAEILSRQRSQQAEGDVARDDATEKRLQAAKDYAAQEKRMQEQQVQQWKQQLDELKSSQDLTLAQEARFWVQRAEFARAGSLAYRDAMDEADKIIARMQATNAKDSREFDALEGGPAQPSDTTAQAAERDKADMYLRSTGNLVDTGALKEQGRSWLEALKSMNEYGSAQGEAQRTIAETAIKMALATGQMSKLDAAQAQAQLHTQEFAEAWERLQDALANAQALPEGAEGQKQLYTLQAQGAQMQGQRTVQAMQDLQAVQDQTFSGATKEALDQMVSAWQDMATAIASTLTRTVGGFNDDIANLLTAKHLYRGDISRAFGGTVREASGSLIKTGLQGAESAVLGGFGFGGKKDGSTEAQALWVRIAGMMTPGGTKMGGDLASLLGGHGGSSGGGFSSSPVGSLITKVFGTGGSGSGNNRAIPAAASSTAAAITTGALGRSGSATPAIAGPLPGLADATDNTPNGAVTIPDNAPAGATDLASLLPGSSPMASGDYLMLPSSLGDEGGTDGAATDGDGNANQGSVTVTKPTNSGLAGNLTSQGTKLVLGAALQGAFAGGGDVVANRPALVGEMGPEIFMPSSGGSIIPNDMLSGGSGDTHNWNIDARGSTDPAQTEQAIQRALRQSGPQFVSAAVASMKDSKLRVPSSRR